MKVSRFCHLAQFLAFELVVTLPALAGCTFFESNKIRFTIGIRQMAENWLILLL
jgi:hypothetical protein